MDRIQKNPTEIRKKKRKKYSKLISGKSENIGAKYIYESKFKLSDNCISDLPERMGSLKNLEILDVEPFQGDKSLHRIKIVRRIFPQNRIFLAACEIDPILFKVNVCHPLNIAKLSKDYSV